MLLVERPGFGADAGALPGCVTLGRVADAWAPWLAALGPVPVVGQSTAACSPPGGAATPGSSWAPRTGALTHAAAACQAPFLPATVLVPVRWAGNRPDRPDRALRWGARIAPGQLDANPGVELHLRHDGNQDALMVSQMAYLRCTWATLPASYRTFLAERLQPGGTVVLARPPRRTAGPGTPSTAARLRCAGCARAGWR